MRGLAAALIAVATPTAAQLAPLAPTETLLLVQGDGEATAAPDTMTITAGVVTTAGTAAAALDANNRQADRLLSAVRAAGVQPRDVSTRDLSVRPNYAEDRNEYSERVRINGYIATNELRLTLRDLSTAGQIISSLFEAGANRVEGPYFSLLEDTSLRQAALRNAVADAQINGNLLASALGKRIVRVLKLRDAKVSEAGEYPSVIITGSRIAGTPIAPGELKYSAAVAVEYVLAD